MKRNKLKHYLSTGLFVVALVVGLSLLSIPAHALSIAFGTGDAGTGGTLTESGGIVTGTDILLDFFIAHGTTGDGQYDVSGAGVGGVNSTALLNLASGPNGGYLTVVGGVSALGIPDGTLLVSGSFTNFGYDTVNSRFHGEGFDHKSPLLLSALGIPTNTSFNFFTFEIFTSGGQVTGAHLQNVAVPEPVTLLLLGSGLLAIGVLGRKNRREKV